MAGEGHCFWGYCIACVHSGASTPYDGKAAKGCGLRWQMLLGLQQFRTYVTDTWQSAGMETCTPFQGHSSGARVLPRH